MTNPYEDNDQEALHAKQEEVIAALNKEKQESAPVHAEDATRLGFFARMAEVLDADREKYQDKMNENNFNRVKSIAAMLFSLIPIVGAGAEVVLGVEEAGAAAEAAEDVAAGAEAAATATKAAAGTGEAAAEAAPGMATTNPTRWQEFINRATSPEFQAAATHFLHEINPVPDVPPAVIGLCGVVALAVPEVALIPPMWQFLYSTYHEALIDGSIGIDMGREVIAYGRERLADLTGPAIAVPQPA